MMNETGPRRTLPDQSSGSLRTFGTPRHPSITNPIPSKRVCFYKSGDPQFSGLRMVINNRTFKTFDALLDNLSKKVPLPFGVRNITTPRGVHAIYTLDELEDGKSYICSDNRKVKPINLALARKKLPPWYHARPVSSRRRTVQKARAFPGSSIHRQEPVVVHTPKKLVVFRNGDPSVKHTVVLQKRTTPTFESILEYISELMEFPVMKLHTSDGRRVDSLPGLILCSGTVVAAGREPFRPANYAMQKSPAPTRLPTNRMGVRRIKTLNRKKKSLPYTSKSRNFSPSSERYIVNRIHNAIRGNSSDIPSNPTNSFELESSHILESVAETEGDTCLGNGAEGQDVTLPSEDDIEKSFRVNQDGSMTVEMRVRLTIKEEETLHWTTTLTRSSVANQLDMSCLPEPEPDQEICLPKSNPLDLLNPAASTDTINKDKNKDDNDEEPPSLGNGASVESSFGEDDQQTQMDLVSPSRARTPGHKQVRKQQASVESIKSVTADGIQEGVVGSYLYRQQTENGAKTEQYCMVTQSTTRPVPKPRRIGSVDANSISGRNVSSFKSAEIMQIESSGDEVTETVLHIYEQQTCQDNFLANIYRQGGSSSGIPSYRPATSETEQLSSNNEFEPELWRPSTASESISIWRAESKSIPSDITSPSTRTDAIHKTNRQHQIPKSTKGKPQQREVNKDKRISSKPNVINKRFRRLTSPGKRQKESSAETADKHKKTFSSAGFIKRIYGNKSKSQKSTSKLKKRAAQNGQESTKSSQSSEGTTKHSLKELNIPLKVNATVTDSVEAHRMEGSQPRGVLTRQPSMHQEKKKVREIVSLPAFNSSSAVTNEYIENWLEKAHNNPAINADKGKESNNSETTPENESEYNPGLINEGGKCFEKNFEIQTLPENVLQTSVKQRIQSFENKTGPSVETTTVTMPNHTTSTNTGHSFAQNNLEVTKSHLDGISKINQPTKISTEIPSDNENKSNKPIKISVHDSSPSPSENLSTEFPPPPSPVDCPSETPTQSNGEYHTTDVPSAASSPLHRHSLVDCQTTGNYPLAVSSTSDVATTLQMDIPLTQGETQLPRSPSIKRVPLVSNTSLERKMSLRKACMDSYATAPVPMNTKADNVLPNGICAAERQIMSKIQPEDKHISSPSCCTSVSPNSLTSEDRMSSASISSTPLSKPPPEETNALKATISTQNSETSSPKPLEKKVKLLGSLSPKDSQPKKSTSGLTSNSPKVPLRNQPLDRSTSPNMGTRKHATPNASPLPERKQKKLQKKTSPYSQSLDMSSPPVRHTPNRNSLSRNLSSDTASETTNDRLRKTDSQRKHHQKPIKSDDNDVNCDLPKAGQEESTTHPPQRANQPDMKPVLDRICNAINSIRQITQNKPPSCPEKFNRLPDFSSNVSSTFGSSSKALLAFLSVITLKDGITNLNIEELNANDVSCAEALRMIDSLREIACIEDSGQLRNSLSDLQKSASKQLLESWSDFQEFKSHSSSQKYSEQEVKPGAKLEQDCAIEENIIDEIMEKLGMPETLKEELASLSVGIGKETSTEEEMSSRTIENSSAEVVDRTANEACNVKNVSQEDRANVDVCAIIQTIPDVERQKQSIIPVTAEIANVVRDVVDREKSPESSDTEEQDECQLLQLHSEEPIPENESGSDEPQQDMSNVEEKMSCQESISTSEPTVQQSSEDELECEYEEIKQESRQGDNPESHCEEEEDNCYAELSASRKGNISSPDSKKQSLSEEEQPEIEPQDLLTEKGQECQTGFMGLNVSLNESTCNSDLDEPSLSEDEQLEVEGKELKVEESFSGPDEELNDQQNHREFNTSREENKVSSEDEEIRDKSGVRKENRDSYITKDSNSLIQQLDNSTKHHSFEEEEDSGNDHSNCEEHVDMEQSNVEDDQVRSSTEDELSYFDRESTTETERTKMNKDKSCAAPAMVKLSEDVNCERAVGKLHAEDVISQSVAERVSLLEKQVADAQNRKNITENSNVRCFSQRKADLEADVEELSSEMSQADLHTRSAPQSSLSFSYDSSGVITTEPESNRVRSIREMFLAKSSTDVQHGQRCLPNTTTLSGLRAETSVSGGYQSQTSSELSSGEEDSSRKSISKGFVRRTIERLYGKTDAIPDEDTSERPPSAPKQKKNSSIFSPFHTARAKAMSELSYFNSNNALDTLNEATRCIAFNAQVGPGESVPIDTGGWIIRDNTLIRKSVSDPVGINKNLADSTKDDGMYEDTQENPPYSLFSTNSEPDERKKCTYFSLPHTSDSEVCQDDSKSSTNGDSIVETQWDSSKMGAERNGALAGMSITDFKLIDNKVHPLIELPPDGEVVMVQPGKGQGIMNRRLQEPDVLDLLYNFCGEHCPIL